MKLNKFITLLNDSNELTAENGDFGSVIDVFEMGEGFLITFIPTDSVEPDAVYLTKDQMSSLLETVTKQDISDGVLHTHMNKIGYLKKLTD